MAMAPTTKQRSMFTGFSSSNSYQSQVSSKNTSIPLPYEQQVLTSYSLCLWKFTSLATTVTCSSSLWLTLYFSLQDSDCANRALKSWQFIFGTETRKRFGERLHPSQCAFTIFLETVTRIECDSNCLVFAVGCWAAQTFSKSLNILCLFIGDVFL